jgi:hypothetical protein
VKWCHLAKLIQQNILCYVNWVWLKGLKCWPICTFLDSLRYKMDTLTPRKECLGLLWLYEFHRGFAGFGYFGFSSYMRRSFDSHNWLFFVLYFEWKLSSIQTNTLDQNSCMNSSIQRNYTWFRIVGIFFLC